VSNVDVDGLFPGISSFIGIANSVLENMVHELPGVIVKNTPRLARISGEIVKTSVIRSLIRATQSIAISSINIFLQAQETKQVGQQANQNTEKEQQVGKQGGGTDLKPSTQRSLDGVKGNDPGPLKPINRDGKITLGGATFWWRFGKGQPLYADAQKIDLSNVKMSMFKNAKKDKDGIAFIVVNLLGNQYSNLSDGLVYGSITLKQISEDKVMIMPDRYDFDIKYKSGLSKRNVLTIFGAYFAGPGQSFPIYFTNNYVKLSK
jgi:hypothetical protein